MTIDLTPIILAIIAGVFATLKLLIDAYAAKAIKDKQSAAVLDSAVGNALGAMQQEAEAFAATGTHAIALGAPPGVSPTMAVGVQYVLDHAGDEAARFGITPASIAGKIGARIGLANIESNIAVAASPADTPAPLAPIVPVVKPQGSPT
jgi:hypothetical protein